MSGEWRRRKDGIVVCCVEVKDVFSLSFSLLFLSFPNVFMRESWESWKSSGSCWKQFLDFFHRQMPDDVLLRFLTFKLFRIHTDIYFIHFLQ